MTPQPPKPGAKQSGMLTAGSVMFETQEVRPCHEHDPY